MNRTVCLLCLLCLLAPMLAAEPLVRSGDRIACVGDSITARGWEYPGGYVRLVLAGLARAGFSATAIPAGHRGFTSAGLSGPAITEALKERPQVVTISAGVNDVWQKSKGKGVDQERYLAAMRKMVETARGAGVRQVLLLTPSLFGEAPDTPRSLELLAYGRALAALARELGCPLADIGAAMRAALAALPEEQRSEGLFIDGVVHLNAVGDRLMASTVLLALGIGEAEVQAGLEEATRLPGSWHIEANHPGNEHPFPPDALAFISVADFTDLCRAAGGDPIREQRRLAAWFGELLGGRDYAKLAYQERRTLIGSWRARIAAEVLRLTSRSPLPCSHQVLGQP